MALGSFTHGALAELSVVELDRMLELDETLFVEHKTDLGATAYGLVSSVAAFANTVGGWLLIGVTKGRANGNASRWADQENAPTLVDAVRDRLRGEIDPLPAFEAKVMPHAEGPVGVVRVYESADTPHVVLSSGAVFVREVAGVSDASDPKRPGAGMRGERAYEAARIRSRAQLVELAARGREANARVDGLLHPLRPLPLITTGINLSFEVAGENVIQPRYADRASVVVRLAPYTLAPRFRNWTTTSQGSGSVLTAAKNLSGVQEIHFDRLKPDPAGAWIEASSSADRRHIDAANLPLATLYRVVVDGAGVVGAAFELATPSDPDDRRWVSLDELAGAYVRPVIEAAGSVLVAGEFLGRARCHIDLVRLGTALRLKHQVQSSGSGWVPIAADLPLPASEADIDSIALRAAYAYGRSAGLRAWYPPTDS